MPPRIQIDHNICHGPFRCSLCLEACREGVLMARPGGGVLKRNVNWRIVPALVSRCDSCGRCRSSCPVNAIRLRLPL